MGYGISKKSRTWLTIVYPESAPEDWLSKLSEIGVQAIISPLHDKDLNADGEIKKPHYHVAMIWEGPTTLSNASHYVEIIKGVGCIPAATLRGSARYFCHLDNPEKYQYEKADVRTIGGIDYETIINSVSDDMLLLYDIFDFIDEHRVLSYRLLLRYCRVYRQDWARLICTSERENVFRYIRSYEDDIVKDRDYTAEEFKVICDSWG